MTGEHSSIVLRALEGAPLADPKVRDTVVAAANAIGERNGVPVRAIRTDATSITIDLGASRLAALGFATELRRLTERWYRDKVGASLWGEGEEP